MHDGAPVSDLHELTALETAAAVRSGDVSALDVVDAALARAERLGPELGAFAVLTPERARDAARALDRAGVAGGGPLAGVPTAIKDLTATAGVPTARGSVIYDGYVPAHDDDVVGLLRAAGTISIGKTAVPEFGLPCYTEPAGSAAGRDAVGHHAVGGRVVRAGRPPRWRRGSCPSRTAPTAAARCASRRRCAGSSGSRPPAGASRPARRAATRRGCRCTARSPARSPTRPRSSTRWRRPRPANPSSPRPARRRLPAAPSRGPRSGCGSRWPSTRRWTVPWSTPSAGRAAEDTAALLAELGHHVEPVTLRLPDDVVAAFLTLWTVLSLGDPVEPADEPRLQPLTRHLRARGREVGGSEAMAALHTVQVATRALVAERAAFDAVLTPTVALPPRPVGWFTAGGDPTDDFARQIAFTPWTAIANLTGEPAISLPLCWSDGLPIGVSLRGRRSEEAVLLALGAELEAARPWAQRRPPGM